ncbi:hypothetical protein H0H93_002077, partial [Arthromyces matolae]
PAASEFNISSSRRCDVCNVDVKISFGGEANWVAHENSEAHKRKEHAPRNRSITSFFSKNSPASTLPRASTSIPRLKSTLPSSLLPPVIEEDNQSMISGVQVGINDSPSQSGNATNSVLEQQRTTQTRQLMVHLPKTVPEASLDDWISQFTSEPEWDEKEYDSAWEMMEAKLNHAIGYSATAEDISKYVRRGKHGVEGLCDWLDLCSARFGVDESLYEGKLCRLEDAIRILITSGDSNSFVNVPVSSENLALPGQMKEQFCSGYHLALPDNQPPHASYPFLLHAQRNLPWDIIITGNKLLLRSHRCSKTVFRSVIQDSTHITCRWCLALQDNNIIMGIAHRAQDGAHENTPWAYLSPSQMYAALERKTTQLNQLKLNGLNMGRKLGIRNRQIDAWKRTVIAIGSENIPRIRALIQIELRQGHSVYSILERIDKAAKRVYSPRGYEQTDYERAFLILKLGGSSAADIVHHAFGGPSVNTIKKYINSAPLRPSVGVPTKDEMMDNLALCHPIRDQLDFGPAFPVFGMVMQIDEIKIQERLRWEPNTNMILGICREHGQRCALEFRSMFQADILLESLQSERVHLASEATVIAFSLLTEDPQDYSAAPFVVSPTCKRESVKQHEQMLRSASSALIASQHNNHRRLYCIASDGDSRRRQVLISMCLSFDLLDDNPIHSLLANLSLFNLKCGADTVTADFDWKHVLKRFRNTLLRLKGVSIDHIPITLAIIRGFLHKHHISTPTIDALLCPNDKQDVVLMLKLLRCISLISSHESDERPTEQSSRRVLSLLGRLYDHLLQAYLNTDLSLNDQLTHLSASAHLILALYHRDKGDFIPVQLYFDVMSMIKNVYFCVAKTQIDNPTAKFWLLLLGTDGLEKVFGHVRTMIGNDTNADQYQLSTRIGGAVQCVNILACHPEWGGQSRRLTLKSLPDSDADSISSKYDHLNPKTMKGDLSVSSVVLSGCWAAGRACAEQELMAGDVDPPFEGMETEGGFDILCPFGKNRIVLVQGVIDSGERNETEEEHDISPLPSDDANPNDDTHVGPTSELNEDVEPDLDDLVGQTNTDSELRRHDPWITFDSSTENLCTTKVHKASVLRLYSNPLAAVNSKERLRRVRGYSQYVQISGSDNTFSYPPHSPELDDTFSIHDPLLTLVRCSQTYFLAVIEVSGITVGGIDAQFLSVERLHEPNVLINGQIMKLALVDVSHQPEQADWEWIGNFEHKSTFQKSNGNWFELINPETRKATRGRHSGKETYAFRSSDLRSSAALLYERIANNGELKRLPQISRSDSFPYRAPDGSACFACDTERSDSNPIFEEEPNTCRLCPRVTITELSAPKLLNHMGGHILHDSRMRDQVPCGLCLSTDASCSIRLKKGTGGAPVVDMEKSRCSNLRSFSVAAAAKHTQKSPCTNHPLECPLCIDVVIVWKYNLKTHITQAHPTAKVDLYKDHYDVTADESVLMMAEYRTTPRTSYKRRNTDTVLAISELHSTRMVLRDISIDASISGSPEGSGLPNNLEIINNVDKLGDLHVEDSSDVLSEAEGEIVRGQKEIEKIGHTDDGPNDPPVSHTVESISSRGRKRKARVLIDEDEDHICAEISCGGAIAEQDMLTCNAPGCTMMLFFWYPLKLPPNHTAAGLTVDLEPSPLSTDLVTSSVTEANLETRQLGQIAKIIPEVFNLVKSIIEQDKSRRAQFTNEVVSAGSKAHPEFNWIVCHVKHHYNFKGVKGKDWDHEHREFDVSFGKTVGYEIYYLREGEFWNEGDGGYLN